MDGPHDLGGKEGFGPIDVTSPPFRHEWERRQWALSKTSDKGAMGGSIDAWRHTLELLPPAVYHAVPYFEKWCIQSLCVLVRDGGVSLDEVVRAADATPEGPGTARIWSVEDAVEAVRANEAFFDADPGEPPAFEVGERVRTLRHGSPGHTRLPAYARGAVGTVTAHHGGHIYADLSAEGLEEGRHLYTVAFTAPELWGGTADPRDTVLLDLWEPYLVPA
ncbi:nitrile hydratase subunit beta [Roseisalinus antarcticus]|uniref:Nitrile hydratase subunit beta n=1 Tax=Roseisalinus antarcticus TaxID=254357 RepID=A0A1Y5RWH5_9RHOB|nr:nitrile hydratase subunit beta [Roseisalinus antarcticus]SLN27189.1 Cobalt-containing nitrile hydratase subunit beta [Roseisalinus antarcticus]